MGVIQLYLILYNLVSAAGWAYLFYLFVVHLMGVNGQGPDPAVEFYEQVGFPLKVIQTAATLEIFHSLLGFVRSPVVTNIIQVGSRLVVVWAYLSPSPASQEHWSLYLLIGSWSFVEIPRYLFYVFATLTSSDKIPGLLFFLRYSLFMILYPTGISGEIFVIFNSLPRLSEQNPFFYRFTLVLLSLYLVGGPYMIMNMFGQRKRAYANRERSGRKPPPPAGLVWPVTNEKTGERATTQTNKVIFAGSIEAVDAELAEKVRREKKWRFGYGRHIVNNVRKCLESPENAFKIAKDGLEVAQNSFEFIQDGKTTSFAKAMDNGKLIYRTGFVKGELPQPKHAEVEVPYGGSRRQKSGAPRPYYTYRDDETVLKGKQLLNQLDVWVEYGTIEQSAADAIRACVDHPEWLDLSDHTFILLGATSAMGPLEFLLQHGAHIVAIDLNRDFIWKKLINRVKKSCGSMTFPYKSDKVLGEDSEEMYGCAGADLLKDTPEIARWLTSLKYEGGVTIGNYTYLDGALHVQLSVACDGIIERVCKYHKQTSVAFLCTPTDVHVIPKEAHDEMGRNAAKVPLWQSLFRFLGFGNILKKNQIAPVKTQDGQEMYLVDGIVAAQGPNYALAKRLQHWRVVVAREEGHVACSNVAPSTATKSVVHNAQFAAAYGGFHLFPPLEVMYQETSNAVMGILLLHDVRNVKSASHPQYPLVNPFQLFEHGAFHGGVSRCAFKVGSIGEAAVISFYLKKFGFGILSFLVGATAVGHW
eukprot:CAMPEP_0201475872 /NCGR_PEP_ID=MMETSP0151_2-20130828/1207_1 /ASSEMBLY_ACC=CAM_ASM_000257 /TAXON_ID=200890 /ORGANISM="Paramoeba atlantica, Strain 621/1 / CCAP 1560/9" /LENGTH=754 /DNA_ID=CAMNT_0047856079 /DNA_START=76 /DNA_END=2337 /DNA_ORIENTATION=-